METKIIKILDEAGIKVIDQAYAWKMTSSAYTFLKSGKISSVKLINFINLLQWLEDNNYSEARDKIIKLVLKC